MCISLHTDVNILVLIYTFKLHLEDFYKKIAITFIRSYIQTLCAKKSKLLVPFKNTALKARNLVMFQIRKRKKGRYFDTIRNTDIDRWALKLVILIYIDPQQT